MTERELIKLEATIRNKMADISKQRVSLKDSGIGSLISYWISDSSVSLLDEGVAPQ